VWPCNAIRGSEKVVSYVLHVLMGRIVKCYVWSSTLRTLKPKTFFENLGFSSPGVAAPLVD